MKITVEQKKEEYLTKTAIRYDGNHAEELGVFLDEYAQIVRESVLNEIEVILKQSEMEETSSWDELFVIRKKVNRMLDDVRTPKKDTNMTINSEKQLQENDRKESDLK